MKSRRVAVGLTFLLLALGTTAGCTLITDVDRSQIPGNMAMAGAGTDAGTDDPATGGAGGAGSAGADAGE
jgi:hypothetical protein